MANPQIQNLLTRLNESFGSNTPSPQIQQLIQQMQASNDTDLSDSASALLAEIEGEHPDATSLVLEIIEVLDRMGI